MDEQSSRHVPVSLPVASASAYHYWAREAIVRVRRAARRPAKPRKITTTSGVWIARPMNALLLAKEQRHWCQAWGFTVIGRAG